jgi:hypothetical protein
MSMTINTSTQFVLSWTSRAQLAFAPTCTPMTFA